MFRRNSSTTKNKNGSPMPHNSPLQLSMENSTALEELCMKDDHYFNLLYKPYDSSKFGINQRNMELPKADPNSLNFLRINRNDKEWLSSVLDYRRMDEELARIQRDCEIIESNIARSGNNFQNYRLTETADVHVHNINLMDPLTTIVHSQRQQYVPTLSMNLTPSTMVAHDNLEILGGYDDTLSELLTTYQSAGNNEGLNAVSSMELESPRSHSSITLSLLKTERPTTSKQKESESEPAPDPQPYKCPVCLKFVHQHEPTSTACGHVFCKSCIKTALHATNKCPVCQKLMTLRQVFRIYI